RKHERPRMSAWAAGLATTSLITWLGVAHAVTPAQNCESAKNKAAGKYAACRQGAEGKFAVTADSAKRTADLAKCAAKFETVWPALEAKAVAKGGACPTVGDETPIEHVIEE